MNHYSQSCEFNDHKQQIEKELQIHKEKYCGQNDCYYEYNLVTFRKYVNSANRIYMISDSLIFNINEHLRKDLSVPESEKTNWCDMKNWANGVIGYIRNELRSSLDAIATSGHVLSNDDYDYLEKTDIYLKIR